MQNAIVQAKDLTKTYSIGQKVITVLNAVSFQLYPGESLAITGPSGSGKTTLLGLLAGLDAASSGSIKIDDLALEELNEDGRSTLRLHKMGFVFQNFQLLPNLTALENVMVPLELLRKKNVAEASKQLLEEVGLSHRFNNYPSQLSGGEQQRVAIARAFVHNPQILMADEPTGNLDSETSGVIESLLFKLNKEQGTTLIIVTHDPELANKADRVLKLKNGSIEA